MRWEAQIQPDPITDPSRVFFADFIGKTVTNDAGAHRFPSNGRIPSDPDMFQPRIGLAYDAYGDNKTLLRASAGIYYARIPGLNLASTRSTNGSRGQSLFRSSELTPVLGPPPAYGELLPSPKGDPFRPNIHVFDENFENPRTLSLNAGIEHELQASGLVGTFDYTYSRTENLTRFVNRKRRRVRFSMVNRPGSGRRQRRGQPDRHRKHGEIPLPRPQPRASACGARRPAVPDQLHDVLGPVR